MCEYENDIKLELDTPEYLSCTGRERNGEWKKIDACIAPLIKALNDFGIRTVSSCCGHGKGNGYIDLWDGRLLEIHKDGDKFLEERTLAILEEGVPVYVKRTE